MKLFIDTNIFFSDPYLESPKIKLLLQCCLRKGWEIYFPDICRLELIQKSLEKIEDITKKIKQDEKKLGKILCFSSYSYQEPVNLERAKQDIQRKIIEALARYNIRPLPIPEIPHNQIVLKAIEKTPPFKSDGSGYRDYLIFQAIKTELTSSNSEGILLSQNKKDFGDTHKLFTSLKNELTDNTSLDVYTEIEQLINEEFADLQIPPQTVPTSEFIYGNLEIGNWITENISNYVDYDDLIYAFFENCPRCSAHIVKVKEISRLTINDEYEEFEDDNLFGSRVVCNNFIEITVSFNSEISFSIDSEDVYCNSDLMEFLNFEEDPFSGDATIWTDEEVSITALLEVDKTNGRVNDCELKEIETYNGSISFD